MALCLPAEGIEGCHVEWSDLEEALKKSLHTKSSFGPDKKSINVGLGVGFNSRICVIQPDWTEHKDNEDLPDRFILKISSQLAMKEYSDLQAAVKGKDAAFSISIEQLKMMEPAVKMLHNVECFMYGKIVDADRGIPVPKILSRVPFTEENTLKGFIAMEEMTELESVMVFHNVSAKEMEQPLRALAKLQAIGETFSDEDRKNVHNNVFTSYFQFLFTVPMVQALSGAIARSGREHLKEKADRMISLIPDYCSPESYAKYDKLYETLGMKAVLCHGDFWSPNLLWRRGDDGQLKLVSLVDYQMCNFGSVAFDLCRILSAGMDGKERVEHTDELLAKYHKFLTEELHGKNIPFTLEQLKQSYELAFPLAMMIILPTLIPLVDGLGADVPVEIVTRVVSKVERLLDDLLFYHDKNENDTKKGASTEKN